VHHLPSYVIAAVVAAKPQVARRESDMSIVPLAAMEKEHILKAYRSTGSNKLQAARLLEVGTNTLRRKLRLYGIE
jgi:DNA-binding NtrC family response regulator